MKIAVSNLAWPADQDQAALKVVVDGGFDGVEVAPQKTFGPWSEFGAWRPREYRARLEAMGLRIPALQAILFGTQHCELFVSPATRANLRAHLGKVAALAGELGAHACVYGAPKTRDPGKLPAQEAWRIAVDFFAEVAPLFAAAGTALAFEANPAAYECRFVTGTAESCRLVKDIGRAGIGVNVDGGTISLNHESMEEVAAAGPQAVHFHASEPHLVPLGSTGTDHVALAAALAAGGYQGWCSAEMRGDNDWLANLQRAGQLMRGSYAARD